MLQRIENAGRKDVHPEMGQIISRRQARRREMIAGHLDRRLFDDLFSSIDPLLRVDRRAADRSEQMQLPFERGLHRAHGLRLKLLVDPNQLAGTAVLHAADIDMIAEKQEEGVVSNKRAGLKDRVPES